MRTHIISLFFIFPYFNSLFVSGGLSRQISNLENKEIKKNKTMSTFSFENVGESSYQNGKWPFIENFGRVRLH